MNKYIYILLLTCCTYPYLCFGQKDTLYLDNGWEPDSATRAVHYCILTPEDSQYSVKCYYMRNGKRSMSGYSLFKDSLYLNGYVDYYNEQGKKSIDAFFKNNIKDGVWEYYDDSTGNISRTRSYLNGKLLEINSFYKNGNRRRHEVRDTLDGTFISGECFDETGKAIKFFASERAPGPGFDLLQYLNKNLRYPAAAKKERIEGRVMIRFVINADGSISDVKIKKSAHPLLDSEAIRLAQEMPKWQAGIQDDKAVSVYFTLPIEFKLK